MELKKYQKEALGEIKSYLTETEKFGPKHAFISVTNRPYKEEFFGGDVPFVCVKIPTGGGKTLVGCHVVSDIMNTTLKEKMDKGIVLWFVPSEAIKSQTLKKFKDRKDWHRRVFDENFDNNVRIFSNEEALRIRKEDVENNICIIVSSLEAFRKEKRLQNKYKVYQENGALMNHFEYINHKDLEKDKERTIINSLANVIRIHNPLIVIDEGHKTKTRLSIEFLKDLNPSLVIEYTATPRAESNILVDVHATELKEENMVKIPIYLESSTYWQKAILRGVVKREELDKLAKRDKGYIRPIALFQAEQEKESKTKITVDQIKEFLITERKISEDEIAIKTASRNELDGVNLFSKKCKIRYIITVNALAEGWDCSFAYILISVANIGSPIAVEQIIGRIIRMPYANKRIQDKLNYSYIFASAKNFNEAANRIVRGLESNGYSKFDLLNYKEKKEKYEFEVKKCVKENLYIPQIALGRDKLTFEELVGDDFKLAKQDHKFKFIIHYDNDGKAIIDIKEGDTWFRSEQQVLRLSYKDKNFSSKELISWLDRKLRFIMLDKEDKMKFIEKVIKYQLNKHSLSELSVNRFVLKDKLQERINRILIDYAKKRFDKFLKTGKISVKNFEKFPDKILLTQEIQDKFNRNFYEKIDKLNKEERTFIDRLDLDTLPNIKFWVRNREKKDPFYIQGWKRNKFYPDFIAVTNKGCILALEWKGAHLKTSEDTQYKVAIAEEWERLGKGKLRFFLVHNENINEVLNEIKNIK